MPSPQEVVDAIVEQYPRIHAITNGDFSMNQTVPSCLWPEGFLSMLQERGQVSFGCHVMNRSGLVIDSMGQVIPCNHMHGYPMGQLGKDFTDAESFANFWMRPDLTGFYDQLVAYPSQSCVSCNFHQTCGGVARCNGSFTSQTKSSYRKGGE